MLPFCTNSTRNCDRRAPEEEEPLVAVYVMCCTGGAGIGVPKAFSSNAPPDVCAVVNCDFFLFSHALPVPPCTRSRRRRPPPRRVHVRSQRHAEHCRLPSSTRRLQGGVRPCVTYAMHAARQRGVLQGSPQTSPLLMGSADVRCTTQIFDCGRVLFGPNLWTRV